VRFGHRQGNVRMVRPPPCSFAAESRFRRTGVPFGHKWHGPQLDRPCIGNRERIARGLSADVCKYPSLKPGNARAGMPGTRFGAFPNLDLHQTTIFFWLVRPRRNERQGSGKKQTRENPDYEPPSVTFRGDQRRWSPVGNILDPAGMIPRFSQNAALVGGGIGRGSPF